MTKIHPSAVVEPGAKIADNVEIGPLCYVGSHVEIGPGCQLIAQCHVGGYTKLGNNNILYPFAALGQDAQDHAVDRSTPRYLEVGDDNIFREGTAIHTGTLPETKTVIGNHCMFMNNAHVAHNCVVGDNVILVSGSVMGGYSEVHDNAILSGMVAIHQFCRVGKFVMISGVSAFSKDVPPFMMAEGRNGGIKMVNVVGMKRAGYSDTEIRAMRNVFKIFATEGLSISNALAKIRDTIEPLTPVQEFLAFCETSKRGVIGGKVAGHRD